MLGDTAPFRVAGNLYFVGTHAKSCHVLATSRGLIMIDGGPERLDAAFDADRLADRLRGRGIDSYASESAGTFVCNDVFYQALYEARCSRAKVLFVHVPFSDRQKDRHPGAYYMETETITFALEEVIDFVREELEGGR